MSEHRYSELKYEGQTYTEQWKIDEILVKNKFNWMVNAEIKNARLEIFNDTLIWNAGIWYAGDWFFGVWRDGEWRYGNWQNGVWYNGVWKNGTFKSGIIYKGTFFKGKIEKGEIRGGNFINVEIAPGVTEYTGDEYQTKKQDEQQPEEIVAQPEPQNPDQVKVHSTKPASQQPIEGTQPRIQQEKINNNMKKLKTFKTFLIEGSLHNAENAGLYDNMSELLIKANILICQEKGDDPEEYEISSPDEALELLGDINTEEASELYDEIGTLNNEIDEIDAEEYFEDED